MSLIATRLGFWYGTVTALNVTAGNHHVHQICLLLSAHYAARMRGKKNRTYGDTGRYWYWLQEQREEYEKTQSSDSINYSVLTFAVQGCMLTGTGSNQAITTSSTYRVITVSIPAVLL